MTEREALRMALEALETSLYPQQKQLQAITALRERLAQPDPVAYWHSEFLKHNTTSEQPAQQQEFVAWQPIETAPKKEVKILLRSFSGLIAEGYFLRAAYNGVGGWVWPYIHQNPVHWMPLPPPPVEAAHGIKE